MGKCTKCELRIDGHFGDAQHPFVRFTKLQPILARCFHHLSQFTDKYPESHKMTSLINDFQTIIKQAQEFESEMTLFFQMEIANETWKEAILSRKVGYIAFAFFPFSLTASLFSMNVERLEQVSLITFLITGLILFLFCFFVAYLAQNGKAFQNICGILKLSGSSKASRMRRHRKAIV